MEFSENWRFSDNILQLIDNKHQKKLNNIVEFCIKHKSNNQL